MELFQGCSSDNYHWYKHKLMLRFLFCSEPFCVLSFVLPYIVMLPTVFCYMLAYGSLGKPCWSWKLEMRLYSQYHVFVLCISFVFHFSLAVRFIAIGWFWAKVETNILAIWNNIYHTDRIKFFFFLIRTFKRDILLSMVYRLFNDATTLISTKTCGTLT